MSRIMFPGAFFNQRELQRRIKAKHDADGASSVITSFLSEHEINLATDLTAGNNAEVHDGNQKTYCRQAESYVEQRDNIIEPTFSGLRGIVQFLKAFYKPNVRRLGDWGVTVDHKNRIVYPADFNGRVMLMGAIKAKHDSYPAGTSPLQPYLTQHSIDLAAVAIIVSAAVTYEANQLQKRRDAEEETQLRDNLWNPVVLHIRQIGDYLMKLFAGSQKKLGEWGFTIDDSPRAPKERISTLKPDSKITTMGIIIGGTLTNIGTVELHVYKGKTATGTPDIVHAGEMLGMTKGHSTTTVVNPSTTVAGKFKVLVSK